MAVSSAHKNKATGLSIKLSMDVSVLSLLLRHLKLNSKGSKLHHSRMLTLVVHPNLDVGITMQHFNKCQQPPINGIIIDI